MTTRSMSSVSVTMAMLAFVNVVVAQTVAKPTATPAPAPRTVDGKPDLSGVWGVINRAPGIDTRKREESVVVEKIYGRLESTPPAMTPWEEERYLYNRDPRKSSTENFGAREELKPSHHCVPYGPVVLNSNMAGSGEAIGGYEIIQSARRVLIIYELDHNVRQIWTDGRGHPSKDELDYTWMGDSIGRWEGDTLVVDTVGIRNEPWIDLAGHVSSRQMRMEERYTRLDHDTMRVEWTVDDPIAFTKPWTQKMYNRLRNWDLAEDVRCYPGSQELRNQEQIFHFGATNQ